MVTKVFTAASLPLFALPLDTPSLDSVALQTATQSAAKPDGPKVSDPFQFGSRYASFRLPNPLALLTAATR